MSATPKLDLLVLTEAQAGAETLINDAHYKLEAVTQLAIVDRDLATPPGSPVTGACYLVATSPTGAWASNVGDIAIYYGGGWNFVTPTEGWQMWVADENVLLRYNGTAWELVSAGAVSLTDAATIATNAALGSYFRVTLGGNRTLGNPTNPKDGQRVTWEFIQDGTGSRTITLDTKFAFGTTIASLTLTTTINKRDFVSAIYNLAADKWYVVEVSKGY